MCDSFYILHVNKCGFIVCRPANVETIPTSISQQDKLKLSHPICITLAIYIILVQHAHIHSWSPTQPWTSSPSPLPSFQSSMHTFTPCAFPQPWTSSFRPCATCQTSMHISSSLSAPYQYTMNSSATPFPPPQSSMHSSSSSAHQTPTGSSNPIQASSSSFFQAYEVQSNSNPIAPPNLGNSPIPRLRRKRMVISKTLNASKNASRYMGAIKFAGSQSSTHAPRKNEQLVVLYLLMNSLCFV